MSDYGDLRRRDRRREILAFLDACADYTSNGDVILDVLNHIGFRSSRDEVVTDLCWLREQGFAAVEDREAFLVVTATQRGVEVARGLVRHPEVSRPRPRP